MDVYHTLTYGVALVRI